MSASGFCREAAGCVASCSGRAHHHPHTPLPSALYACGPLRPRHATRATHFRKQARWGGLVRAAVSTEVAEATGVAASLSRSKRVVLESEEELRSTWEHRAWVWGANGLLAAMALQGVAHAEDAGQGVAAALAVLVAYVLADFGTGVYHWSVDNYGDGSTPLVGDQIAAFQGHHQRPWTITEREFCNNVHKVFKPAVPFAALFALAAGSLPPWLDTGLAAFIWLVCMSQQFHAWSHMKRSELPAAVVALQDAGLLISQRAHGAHHKAPFEGNYCIVSGWWNDVLDAGGADSGFFRRLERAVHAATGVEPRCWREPDYEWVDSYFKPGEVER